MVRASVPMRKNLPLVVKVGGSLLHHLPELVPVLRAAEQPLLIVPGGGPFADAVRDSGADGDAAHWMAVAAMDQYGWCIASQGIPVTHLLAIPRSPSIFLSYCSMRRCDPLPHSWDVTSDSIAAWIAHHLSLELILLKSVDGIIEGNTVMETVTCPVRTDTVDPYFLPFVLEHGIATTIINGSEPDRVRKILKGMPVPGTRIGTTF